MFYAAMAHEPHSGGNVYLHWAVMRPDLPEGKRGGEADIICLLASVLDADNGKGDHVTLIAEPDFVIESSAGNFQHFYIFDRALKVNEARPLLAAHWNAAGGHRCAKDVNHVYRLAGALNWPTARKRRAGRSPHPQQVKVVKASDQQTYTNVDNFTAILKPRWDAPRKERAKVKPTGVPCRCLPPCPRWPDTKAARNYPPKLLGSDCSRN
jgi:RepB DNA-primase from phage plasmid